MTIQLFDRSTGAKTGAVDESGVMHFLLQLHTDMFLGLPGMLFLGLMGLFFVIAIVSGVVLYAPFMRKLDFGTLRTTRSRRVKWLDYHNLLGIVALAWMTVVGATGVINALATPIFQYWQLTELAEMTKTYAGKGAVPPERYGSIDRAMAAARAEIPGNNPQFIAFPGGAFSSQHHYAVFFQGDTPLTERLLTSALIDAETGEFHRRAADALVCEGAGAVAAAAFRRLWRAAAQNPVGDPDPLHDHRAGFGPLPLARQAPRRDRRAGARGRKRRPDRSCRMNQRRGLRAIFAIPLLLALASVVGLVIALTGDGLRDAASWAALAIPVLAVGWAMRARRT